MQEWPRGSHKVRYKAHREALAGERCCEPSETRTPVLAMEAERPTMLTAWMMTSNGGPRAMISSIV